MRRLALGLIYLLLPGGLRAQEPGPASMVDGVFAAARAEAQAFWREYCAANESGSFRGEFDQLPSWPRYLARLEQAAAS